jgi:hypothetical protein
VSHLRLAAAASWPRSEIYAIVVEQRSVSLMAEYQTKPVEVSRALEEARLSNDETRLSFLGIARAGSKDIREAPVR